jgi:hypothetical protein
MTGGFIPIRARVWKMSINYWQKIPQDRIEVNPPYFLSALSLKQDEEYFR